MGRLFPGFAVSLLAALFPVYSGALAPLSSWRAAAPVKAVAFARDGRKAYFASGNSVGVWDLDARPPRLWNGHTAQVLALSLSPDGRRLLSAGADESLMLWDAESGRELATWTEHEGSVTALVFSPDGARALSADDGGGMILWNAVTGARAGAWAAPGGRICALAFLPDGRGAVSGSMDESLRAWSVPEGRLTRSWTAHRNHACALAASRDGGMFLSGGGDGLLRLWDSASWKELGAFKDQAGPVRSVALSPDGTRALCGRAESLVELWEMPGGRKAAAWRAHEGAVHAVAFSPEGRRALSGGDEGALSLWDLAAAANLPAPGGGLPGLEREALESQRRAVRLGFEEKKRSARQEAEKFGKEEERARLELTIAGGIAGLGGLLGLGLLLARGPWSAGAAGGGTPAPFKPMEREALLWAAAEEGECAATARRYHEAGMGAELIAQSRDAPGDCCAAYARAFLKLGDARTALTLLQMKEPLDPADFPVLVASYRALGLLNQLDAGQFPPDRRISLAESLAEAGLDREAMEALLPEGSGGLALGEFIVAMRVCLRLGNFNLAQELLAKAAAGRGPREAPDFHFHFAHFCERLGRIEQAGSLYESLLQARGRGRQAAERLRNLEAVSPEEALRIRRLGERRGPDPRRSLSATGVSTPPEGAALGNEIIGGKFELQETLGIGGMGVVYKGWDRALSRIVAIKKMHEAMLANAASRARFIEEALVVARLNHPYIVSIYDIARAQDVVYLIFEFVDGQSLSEMIAARGRIAPPECARLLRFVGEALVYAHEKKVIHRDLKPANAMVDRRGYLKVMDFGLARRVEDSSDAARGEVAGTLAYMAPEQHEGRFSPLSDIFSLGAMAYEMASGDIPFSGPDFRAQKRRNLAKPLPADIPAGLAALIGACLQGEPEKRPQTITAVLEALKEV